MSGPCFHLFVCDPEQMIGAMYQAGRIRTTDQASHLFVRFGKFTNENDFLKEYGDATDDELFQQSGTIPQASAANERKDSRAASQRPATFSAAGQIMRYSGDNEAVVENCFLACLTRMPNDEERDFFVLQLQGAEKSDTNTDQNVEDGVDTAVDVARPRHQVVRDMYWVLFNSPDFSWNK